MSLLQKRSAACTAIKRLHSAITSAEVSEWDMVRLGLEQKALDQQFHKFQAEHSAILDHRLKLRPRTLDVAVHGIGATQQATTHGQVTLSLRSTRSSLTIRINALVIPTITSELPDISIDLSRWPHIANLPLADKHFGTPSPIDILLGADVWGLLVEDEVIHGLPHEPHAQKTRFGWVIFGPTTGQPTATLRSFYTQTQRDSSDEQPLDELVKRFWQLEELHVAETREDECSQHYQRTHSRTPDGRYMVRIPFRHDAPALGDSYQSALRQFYCLERRLASNLQLRKNYQKFMREYETLGHMERVDQHGDHPNCYYIPHHAVVAKFRVVFNASAKSTTGVSLNDIQLVGPTIQESLVNVIFGFRRYRFALTADVEKMFRQILVAPEHRDFQRILWRETPTDPLTVFRLTTVTYGMASSPYTSVRSLVQCARDNHGLVTDRERAGAALETIEKAFYVDDLLTSCNSETDAINLARDVNTVLLAGHFPLRKWNSNSARVIGKISNGSNSSCLSTELAIECPTATVLGLRWDPSADELYFLVDMEPPGTFFTKRKVLSEVAQLFDPTGLLAPVVILGKMFIQTLWSTGLTWDAPLPPELDQQWSTLRASLVELNQIRVPRWLGLHRDWETTIHGFCDASSKAYAAVIYLRTVDDNNQVTVSLLTAKTKVAPIKGATIPRLELCAATLLARMVEDIRHTLNLTMCPYFLWSDSRIVLCWLAKEPSTLKPYTANRVRVIQENTNKEHWHHVRSAQNPADCASRGLSPTCLIRHQLWWQGPSWIHHGPLPLGPPGQLETDEVSIIELEAKTTLVTCVTTPSRGVTTRRLDGTVICLTERFSSIAKVLRTVAYMQRWLKAFRHLTVSPVIGADEMESALDRLIRVEQSKHFSQEIEHLRRRSSLPSSSPLLSLNPCLDIKGVLRVGGRLIHAPIPYEKRFPIVLPRRGSLVWLLVRQAHLDTLHGGVQLMLQTLRYKYWIIHGRQVVRTFLHQCVICRRHRGTLLRQQMAPLPIPRVNPTRPFQSSGVDYCGPFTLRVGNKRSRSTVKGYLAVFICMVTKAVHIEVIEDLASQSFLDAFTRFTSRRGPCSHLYSDNGTAFVGANRLMKEDLEQFQSHYNQQALATAGTTWHFITPGAPHQGGLWEAAVKSAKHHLKRVVGGQSLWYHQLHTLATRIEACLNSRPLVPLHDDPEDRLALTPADFLIGGPIIAVPETSLGDVPINRLKQYQWIRKVHQEFWQRWSEEYLTTLQSRGKWERPEPEIQVGDIVLVRHENLPPTHWRLGRVITIHPGSDGHIRNVTLKTQSGECHRPIQKLSRLIPNLSSDRPQT